MTEQQGHKRLANFVRENQAAIVKDWTEFARTLSPASDKMSKLALDDHIVDILGFVADDLESTQTPREQFDKSRGERPKDGPFSESAAEIHAALRLADGFDIDQVMSNLMGNAIHYGDVSSPITVTVVGSDPETVVITVHNQGPPIRLETQNLIFQSWMRGQDVKDPPEQSSHLGLGLYIAKLIVEAHGGGISVTSNEQAGTTFSLRLPRS